MIVEDYIYNIGHSSTVNLIQSFVIFVSLDTLILLDPYYYYNQFLDAQVSLLL